jgi:hypothetical protein
MHREQLLKSRSLQSDIPCREPEEYNPIRWACLAHHHASESLVLGYKDEVMLESFGQDPFIGCRSHDIGDPDHIESKVASNAFKRCRDALVEQKAKAHRLFRRGRLEQNDILVFDCTRAVEASRPNVLQGQVRIVRNNLIRRHPAG